MLNRTIDALSDHSWIPSSAWRRLGPSQRKFARKKADPLDEVPVMSATVLGLEMLLHEPCIDLRMASELVLSDVGATIQVLRLVGSEYELATEHPCRMGECLASLDSSTWFEAVSARTFGCDREHAAIASLWNHCRLVAQYAQLVAESLDRILPEEAYLVGLLHEIGAIPKVLGFPNRALGVRDSGALLTMEGSLPLFVLTAIRSVNDSCSSSVWKFILNAAHELAGAGTDFDPSAFHDLASLDVSSPWRTSVVAAADCMLRGS
jgi:HDOD domain